MMEVPTDLSMDVSNHSKGDGGDKDGFRNDTESTYAEKTAADNPSRRDAGSKPVFMRQADISNAELNQPTGEEIYLAISKSIAPENIMGIQNVGGIVANLFER